MIAAKRRVLATELFLRAGSPERGRLRVCSLLGQSGRGMGRAEWERHYYGDRIKELQRMANAEASA